MFRNTLSGNNAKFAGKFYFRGQANAEWKLTPIIFRNQQLFPHETHVGASIELEEYKNLVMTEIAYLHQAVNALDRNRVCFPGDTKPFRELLDTINDGTVIFHEPSWIKAWPPRELHEPLALMQHYGFPDFSGVVQSVKELQLIKRHTAR